MEPGRGALRCRTTKQNPKTSAVATRPNPPSRAQPILSIRARLIVLALLAIAPLMLERVHGLERARAERTERANAEVIDLARRGVEAQREIIDSMRALAADRRARLYAGLPHRSGRIAIKTLTDLTANIPWIRGISVAGTDGRIICSTEPMAIGLNVVRSRRISRTPSAFARVRAQRLSRSIGSTRSRA